MKKRITLKQSLFLLPLLLLLLIFAVYPILTSAVYSLFDYRTNDQTVAGLYTGSTFNAPLFYEDCGYVTWYLEDDVQLLEGSDHDKMQAIIDEVYALGASYEGATEVVSMDQATGESIKQEENTEDN